MSYTTPPEPSEFPSYKLAEFLPPFLLGWGLGAAITFAVRALGQHFNTSPCEGHTLLALIVPLLLGPGGLGFVAANWRTPSKAALGLGLVVSSLVPALYVGARDISHLRTIGCAGGYVVIAPVDGASISRLNIPAGSQRQLTARIGGFTPTTHPNLFTLQGQSTVDGVKVILGKTQVHAGEVFPFTVSVDPSVSINIYSLTIQANTQQQEKTVSASGSIEVNVEEVNVEAPK